MGLDIRWPIGLMFALIGAMLTFYGVYSKTNVSHAGGADININFVWGIVLTVFGVLMIIGALTGKKK
jgi:hypothetical protein